MSRGQHTACTCAEKFHEDMRGNWGHVGKRGRSEEYPLGYEHDDFFSEHMGYGGHVQGARTSI
jgi:hypothetical protein